MAAPFRRIVAFLRSRRLAIALIAAVAVYGIIGTLVPMGAPSSPAVRAWAAAYPAAEAILAPLGMHQAFSSPLFLSLILLLAASTTACAVERTRRATRLAQSLLGGPTDALVDRLARRPEAVVPVRSAEPSDEVLQRVASSLGKAGLRTSIDDDYVGGRAGVVGLWGSPLFHWSIILLMVVIAAGQATRAEGFIALPLDQKVDEAHSSYLQVVEGPLFGERHTGVKIEMTKLDRDFVKDGVDFGPSPYVRVTRGAEPIAEGWVHANSPLRVGSLMIHMVSFGPVVTLAIESAGGGEIAREVFPLDVSEEGSSGIVPQVFTLSDESGVAGLTVRVRVLPKDAAGGAGAPSRAQLETATAGSSDFGPAVIVPEGSALDLSGGRRLRVVSVSDWARVSVANDWSVPYLYGLLVLAILVLAVALLVPARRAGVLLVETSEGRLLHIATWHDKRDPLFKERMLSAVAAAAAESEEE
jgi:hypothetical protein